MPYTITLSWKLPLVAERVSGYHVFVNDSLDVGSGNITSTSSMYVLENLQEDAKYVIVIQAINPSGTSGNVTLRTRTLKGKDHTM